MYLACSSESYVKELDAGRLTLADWLRLAAEELGLKAVELEDKHVGSPTPQRLAAVRAAADRYGLEIVNIALMNNFGLADDARRAAVDRLDGAPRQTCPRQIYEDLLRWQRCTRGSRPGVPLAACERLYRMCVHRV